MSEGDFSSSVDFWITTNQALNQCKGTKAVAFGGVLIDESNEDRTCFSGFIHLFPSALIQKLLCIIKEQPCIGLSKFLVILLYAAETQCH